jgi:DMSO/TMAO reductase YedYZ molybdopterin-dependent catalytic subunit
MKTSVIVLFLCLAILAEAGLSCSRAETISTTTPAQVFTIQKESMPDSTVVISTQPATIDEVSTVQATPEKDISAFRLRVDGLVNLPLSLTYESILQYPAVTQKVELVCPGVFETNRDWTGVQLATLLQDAEVKTEASKVVFTASDGYHMALPIVEAQQEGVFVAYQVNGGTLSVDDGYPVRLVASQREGAYWVRQLVHIEVE